ncbi:MULTISPECIES: hypothetical protein [Vibrio]|uniref:hypothetical protein n=1 Tax=Vibrio TaxID=662 RepID=UPI0020756EF2|nr:MULTISPECIES: hypothetical protein [Vibrio]USD35524.1 hypothetical protein J8Z27_23170 [Vibrio sp. SCSIO 43186]USD72648.1 hypothetical protein J4N41_23175 [Vibrio sp. SCSIO 43139]USD98859.1 hypothetical protein CTT30_22515 [Vibrio coralliilyticus]
MRFGVGVVFLVLHTALFIHGLNIYVSGVPNPSLMMFMLGFSLLIAFVYDLKTGRSRRTLALLTSSAVLFSIAPYMAIELRVIYLDIISILGDIPIEELEANGYQHYVNILLNPMMGIGSCFAIALAVIRLVLGRLVTNLLLNIILGHGGEYCASCGSRL